MSGCFPMKLAKSMTENPKRSICVLSQVVSILDMIRNSVSQAPEAAALFYDELARIIQLGDIDPKIEVLHSVINGFA